MQRTYLIESSRNYYHYLAMFKSVLLWHLKRHTPSIFPPTHTHTLSPDSGPCCGAIGPVCLIPCGYSWLLAKPVPLTFSSLWYLDVASCHIKSKAAEHTVSDICLAFGSNLWAQGKKLTWSIMSSFVWGRGCHVHSLWAHRHNMGFQRHLWCIGLNIIIAFGLFGRIIATL